MDLVLREDPNATASQSGAIVKVGFKFKRLLSLAPRCENCVQSLSTQSVLHLLELLAVAEDVTSLLPNLLSDVTLLRSCSGVSAEGSQEFCDLRTEALLLFFHIHLPRYTLHSIHSPSELITYLLR